MIVLLAWLLYSLSRAHLFEYPSRFLVLAGGDSWRFTWGVTAFAVITVLVERYGSGEDLVRYLVFCVFSGVIAFPSNYTFPSVLPNTIHLVDFCQRTCAPVSISFIGGFLPLLIGSVILVVAYRFKQSTLSGHLRYMFVLMIFASTIIQGAFLHVTILELSTDALGFGLALFPIYAAVSYDSSQWGTGQKRGRFGASTLIWGALMVYGFMAVVNFLTDLTGLVTAVPVILGSNINSEPLTIGGAGLNDGNFLFPLGSFIGYLLTCAFR